MKYAEIIELLAESINNNFNEVYHSVELITADEIKKPMLSLNNEWLDLSPTDTKETVYIRRNGDDEVMEDMKLGGCIKSYKMRSQLRIVYFSNSSEDHNGVLRKLMQSVLVGSTKLNKIIRDKYKLLKDESSGAYTFGPKAAYFAVDIYTIWELITDTCEDICIELENPLIKQ